VQFKKLFKSLKFRLMVLSFGAMIPLVIGIFSYLVPMFRENLIKQKRNEIQIATTLVTEALDNVTTLQNNKVITPEVALEMSKDVIRTFKYNKTDYFFAYDTKGVCVAHGLKKEMEGTDRSEAADPRGKKYVKDFIALAETPGEGFVDYMFEKEKGGKIIDKISFIKKVSAQNWIVGTGLYIEDIEDLVQALKIKVGLAVLLLLSGALIVSWFFSHKISSRLIAISDRLLLETDKMSEAAVEISETSETLSQSSSQQAAALQETSASLEETSAMITKNADNANNSMKVVDSSQTNAERGKEIIVSMIQSMDEISESNQSMIQMIEQNNAEITDIVRVINDIENKTKVINEIVFQTKLLSFNASVEAARAGEHGKGFSVVAEEVGSLANMSGKSANEISSLLSESVKKVEVTISTSKERATRMMALAKEKIERGTETVRECEGVLEEIVKNVNQVHQLMNEISTASKEQSLGVSEINKAMSELDSVSQKNSSVTQKTSHSASSLKEQVVVLREMTGDLYETVWGEKKEAS